MRSLLRSSFLGLLAVAGALGVACSPAEQAAEPALSKAADATPISSKELKATVAQLNTASTSGIRYMLWDSYNWINNQGCAACHRGFPLYGAALAYKNGLTVDLAQLDGFGTYVGQEQFRRMPNNGTKAMWDHDSGYHMFTKGTFEFLSLAAYNAYRSNAYQGGLEAAVKWFMGPVEIPAINGGAAYNHRGGNGWSQYDGSGGPSASAGTSTWVPARNASTGVWTYTFPNDGKLYAGQTLKFFPADWSYQPVGGSWYQQTGLAATGVSLYLNANPPIAQATKNTYIAFRDELLKTLAAGFYRDNNGNTTAATGRLYYMLSAYSAAGKTPATDAAMQAMVNKLLSLKPAGVTGWGDSEWGWGARAVPTGQALIALCQAGVRLDQNPEIRNAIDWLLAQQINSNSCLVWNTSTNLPGCWSHNDGTINDFPTMYAATGLSCYGVLNVNISATNVAPADPGQAGAAKLSPGAAATQQVTFGVSIFNNGYDNNSFNLTASGGFGGNGGTALSLSTATLTVAPNATGVATLTATFPANLPLSTQAPITVQVKYTGPNGQVTSNLVVPVNIGSAVDPNQALATNTVLTSSLANITIGQTATLTATVRANVNNALAPGGSVTFSGPGFSATVPTNGAGVATYSWNTSNAVAGLQSISAQFGGYNSGVAGQSQYAGSTGSVQVTVTAPPPPPTPGISGPANGYSSTNGNVTVTGTSNAGVIITVRTSNGGNLGSVTVPAGGAFSVPLSLTPGVYIINAVATNAGGNSAPTSNLTITINPQPPVIVTPAANTTTANGTVAISGTGYAGSTVTVLDGAVSVGTFTVDAAGNWGGNVALGLGAHTLNVTQSINGATSAATSRSVGILPPAPTITSPAANANLPNGNNVVVGACTTGTTVTIYDNGVTTGVTGLCANGQYNITVGLGYGSHVLTTTATNNAGASAQSAGRTVSVAPGAPVITAPAAASSDITGPFTFAGTGVVGATVRIYDNGVEINNQVIAANGTFSYTVNAPTLGGHNLTATQTSNGQTSPASAARTITVHNDSDGDTIYDEIDNCVALWNKDQVDRDVDGIGDVCDKAPGQLDASNNTTSATDASLTTDPSADTNLLAANQNNLLNLPAGAWATRSTLTLVNIPANNSGNIEIWGKASPSVAAWTKMTSYDAQLGTAHPATLAGGLTADVAVTTPRTSLANYANRYKQFQVRVKEADGSVTTIPHCASGTTVSAVDDRCVNSAIAYTLVDGTNVDAGIKLIFKMKAF